jgi:DNA-directed RNA polymerase specialized sigma24 family protein
MAWQEQSKDGPWTPAEFLGRLGEVVDAAFRLATVMLRDEAAAEDVVFRTALVAARRRPSRDAPSFRAWFLAMVATEAGRARLRALLPYGSGGGAEELDAEAALQVEAWRSLAGLSKGDCLALFCFFYLRLPMSEIAAVLRTSVRGARRRIHRAVRRRSSGEGLGQAQGAGDGSVVLDRRSLREAFDLVTRPPTPVLMEQIQRALAESDVAPRRALVARGIGIGLAVLVLVGFGIIAYAHHGWVVRPSKLSTVAGQERTAPEVRLEPTPTPATPSPLVTATPTPTPTPTSIPTPSSGPALTPAVSPVPALPAPDPGFSCSPQSGGGGAAQLTAVRVGLHPTYDRFVMQFDGPVPRYQVTLQGSMVVIVLQGTEGSNSYPLELRPGYVVLQAAWQRGATAGTVEWELQLARPECLHVFTLGSPSRLVVDVQHG